MRFLYLLFFCILIHPLVGEGAPPTGTITTPPSPLPVKVESSFSLVDLSKIDEKEETFQADVYFFFRWHDPRLAFKPEGDEKVKVFLEEAAVDKLKDIWWPQLEFKNASQTTYNNRSLFIYANGRVEYYISVTSIFRSHLDFRRFPFDVQNLYIIIDSFLWNKNIFIFVPITDEDLLSSSQLDVHNEERIVDILQYTEFTKGLKLEVFGNSDEYSTFVAKIVIKRKFGFFLYQVLLPLVIGMVLSCSVLFVRGELVSKMEVLVAAFLAFVAIKFTINLDLPRIGYMTVIDDAFVMAYIGIALTTLATILEITLEPKNEQVAKSINFHARWAILTFFVTSLILIFLFA